MRFPEASRRDLLRCVGVLSGCGLLQGELLPGGLLKSSVTQGVAYGRSARSIDVFQNVNGRWKKTQSVASERPAFVLVEARSWFLFAVNEVDEYLNVPAGSVESYAIDPGDGHLTLIGRQSLSLSATGPRHFAISPNGKWMVVAAYGGGIYNVLPISRSGEIGRVRQIMKEIGSGGDAEKQAAAHPHSVAFHPSGEFVISTDFGSDRITAFAFVDGELRRKNQIAVEAGSGPGRIAMDGSGSLILVTHELRRLRSRYRFDCESGLSVRRT